MKTRSEGSLVHDLRELIAAIDRRMPRLEREGESAIARDAQGLRRVALKRIAELEQVRFAAAPWVRRPHDRCGSDLRAGEEPYHPARIVVPNM